MTLLFFIDCYFNLVNILSKKEDLIDRKRKQLFGISKLSNYPEK